MLHTLPLSWLSLIYTTGVGLAMVPVLLHKLGAEAFGLIGFFSVVQSIFLFADLGLPALIGRMAALQSSNAMPAQAYEDQKRGLYRLVIAAVATLALLLWALSDWIVGQWLKPQDLQADTVQTAFMAMVVCAGMRVLGAVDVAVLNSLNQQRWLAWANMVLVTLKMPGAWVSMALFGATPQVYWVHLLFAHMVEWWVLRRQHICNAPINAPVAASSRTQPSACLLKLAWGLFGNSILWTLVFGLPLALASGVLPLDELGYLTLALTVANGIRLLCESIHTTLKTRLTHLHALGQAASMWHSYRQASRLMAALVGGAMSVLALFGDTLMFWWTGHLEAVPDLPLWLLAYAGGHALLSMAGLALDWLYAKGHLTKSLPLQAALMVPWALAMAWAMQTHGGLWAGWVWLFGAAVQWLVLSAWVHMVHEHDHELFGLWRDMAVIALPMAGMTAVLKGWR